MSSLLVPILSDTKNNIEVLSSAALALGMIYVGSGNAEIAQTFTEALMDLDSNEAALNSPLSRYIALGLGLIYLSTKRHLNFFFFGF